MDVAPQPSARRGYPIPRMLGAIAIALVADAVNFFTSAAAITIVEIPLDLAVDGVTALLLWVVLGRPAILLPALVMEAIPGVGMAPWWTVAVAGMLFVGPAPVRSRTSDPALPPGDGGTAPPPAGAP